MRRKIMSLYSGTIHVKVSTREGIRERDTKRDSFWLPFQKRMESSIPKLEGALIRNYGTLLRNNLVREIERSVRELRKSVFPFSDEYFERYLFEFVRFPNESKDYNYYYNIFRNIEISQEKLLQNEEFKKALRRLDAATRVFFSTRIVGYASLNFDILTGSFSELVKVFDGNFDAFRVFLDAFIPISFGNVFDPDISDDLEFSISISPEFEKAFNAAVQTKIDEKKTIILNEKEKSTILTKSASREKAEYIWRIANGSLLLPVLLTFLVLYYGLQLLSDIRKSHEEMLKPILQHQIELLKEDRLRMSTMFYMDTTKINKVLSPAPSGTEGK